MKSINNTVLCLIFLTLLIISDTYGFQNIQNLTGKLEKFLRKAPYFLKQYESFKLDKYQLILDEKDKVNITGINVFGLKNVTKKIVYDYETNKVTALLTVKRLSIFVEKFMDRTDTNTFSIKNITVNIDDVSLNVKGTYLLEKDQFKDIDMNFYVRKEMITRQFIFYGELFPPHTIKDEPATFIMEVWDGLKHDLEQKLLKSFNNILNEL